MTSTYICEECRREFREAWTEAEAMDEYTANFPGHSKGEEKVRICDDCYKDFMRKWRALQQ